MRFRGSLKQCIDAVSALFTQQSLTMLSIICSPRGKYYFVLTEEELLDYNMRDKSNEMRLVFRGSPRELLTFARTVQPDLFQESKPDERT